MFWLKYTIRIGLIHGWDVQYNINSWGTTYVFVLFYVWCQMDITEIFVLFLVWKKFILPIISFVLFYGNLFRNYKNFNDILWIFIAFSIFSA